VVVEWYSLITVEKRSTLVLMALSMLIGKCRVLRCQSSFPVFLVCVSIQRRGPCHNHPVQVAKGVLKRNGRGITRAGRLPGYHPCCTTHRSRSATYNFDVLTGPIS